MTHLYLIRHADYIYDWEDGKRRDLGLSPEGVKQAESLRDRLTRTGEIKPDVFICSTERGAQETAQIISTALEQQMILDKEVEEWRSEDGTLSSEEFWERWRQVPDNQKPYYRWLDGCETRMEFFLRVHVALNRIIHQHEGKTILLLTHGGVIQTSFVFFFGFGEAPLQRASFMLKNTSITHWLKPPDQSRWLLERFNDYHHLN